MLLVLKMALEQMPLHVERLGVVAVHEVACAAQMRQLLRKTGKSRMRSLLVQMRGESW